MFVEGLQIKTIFAYDQNFKGIYILEFTQTSNTKNPGSYVREVYFKSSGTTAFI